jgi:CPA2 family monovalent cation:H+ antiporter-2
VLHAEGLKALIIFLVVAGIVVPLFHRARIGTVLGFLIAGVVLGPHGLGRLAAQHPWFAAITFDKPEQGAVLAEFGIIILLFLLGLELSLQRLWQSAPSPSAPACGLPAACRLPVSCSAFASHCHRPRS